MLPAARLPIAASSAAGLRMLSCVGSSASARRRLQLFQEEKARQEAERCGTLEKIIVSTFVHDGEEDRKVDLLMNKNLSTGYDCARQISRHSVQNAALCLRNGTEIIGLQEILTEECEIDFLDFIKPRYENDVNKAYWRACSLILGSLVQSSFRGEVFPGMSVAPEIQRGSFAFDAQIKGLKKWEPTAKDLDLLSKRARSAFIEPQQKIEMLRVPLSIAEEMFGSERLSAEENLDTLDAGLAVFCVGDHVNISNGPVADNIELVGKFQVAGVEQIGDDSYRFKGVSLPRVQQSSSYVWNILVNAAAAGGTPETTQRTQEAQA
ncbi:hypothetical protein L596_011873 [Steinernema carpocapsae]|uniref:TGS domain-containing protein n=1 Tax=Steinernema carpocapsae TaxID=34508 RepID=A0A4U5NVR1_STECR|nr:hypothetical protein L596_011873 [Steinernema carpocapsae]